MFRNRLQLHTVLNSVVIRHSCTPCRALLTARTCKLLRTFTISPVFYHSLITCVTFSFTIFFYHTLSAIPARCSLRMPCICTDLCVSCSMTCVYCTYPSSGRHRTALSFTRFLFDPRLFSQDPVEPFIIKATTPPHEKYHSMTVRRHSHRQFKFYSRHLCNALMQLYQHQR